MVPSARKVMVTVLIVNLLLIIFIDYLENRRMITWQYYAQLFGRFDDASKRKRPHSGNKKLLLHHNIVPVYWFFALAEKLVELGDKLLSYRAYSSDLVSSDFLFPNMKKNDLVETNVYWMRISSPKFKPISRELIDPIFLEGLKNLEYRWAKCIDPKDSCRVETIVTYSDKLNMYVVKNIVKVSHIYTTYKLTTTR